MNSIWKVVGSLAILLVLGLVMAAPVYAHEMETGDCSHDATIGALRDCVLHASAHGHIDSTGITRALLAKTDAAAAALLSGNLKAAVNILETFTSLVDAQAGRHIHPEHAEHLRSHAVAVIAALDN